MFKTQLKSIQVFRDAGKYVMSVIICGLKVICLEDMCDGNVSVVSLLSVLWPNKSLLNFYICILSTIIAYIVMLALIQRNIDFSNHRPPTAGILIFKTKLLIFGMFQSNRLSFNSLLSLLMYSFVLGLDIIERFCRYVKVKIQKLFREENISILGVHWDFNNDLERFWNRNLFRYTIEFWWMQQFNYTFNFYDFFCYMYFLFSKVRCPYVIDVFIN